MFGIAPTVDDPFAKLENSAAVLRTFGINEQVLLDAAKEGKRIRADYDDALVELLARKQASPSGTGFSISRKPATDYVLRVSANYDIWQPGMDTAAGVRETLEALVQRFRHDYTIAINNNSNTLRVAQL